MNAKPFERRQKAIFGSTHPSKTEEKVTNGQSTCDKNTQSDDFTACAHVQYSVSTLTSVRAVLSHYTQAMLNYPRIVGASPCDRSSFRNALCAFLLSHTAQIADNSSFATQPFWNSSTTSVFASLVKHFSNGPTRPAPKASHAPSLLPFSPACSAQLQHPRRTRPMTRRTTASAQRIRTISRKSCACILLS